MSPCTFWWPIHLPGGRSTHSYGDRSSYPRNSCAVFLFIWILYHILCYVRIKNGFIVSHSSKLLNFNAQVIGTPSIVNQPGIQVTIWDFRSVAGVRAVLQPDPSACGVWCWLQVDSVSMIDCRACRAGVTELLDAWKTPHLVSGELGRC